MAVLRPSGELDLATVDRFRREVQAALADAPEELVLDLRDVTFLDSSGIAVLASALRAQQVRGGRLVLAHPQGIVGRALDLVGLGALVSDEVS